jgi:UDP-N-acetylglucosamine:LPS N-acetylglucosamine transferase
MSKKKILLTMQEAGAAHKMTANAIKDAIDQNYPNEYETEVIDFFKALDPVIDQKMKDIWDWALANPWGAKLGYKLLHIYPLSHHYFDIVYANLNRQAVEYFKKNPTDIVVSTHFWSTRSALYAKRKLNLDMKIINYVMDPFDGNRMWAEKDCDYLLVTSDKAKRDLLGYNIPEEKIRIMGYPVNNSFTNIQRTKEEIAAEYNLSPEKKTILVAVGGQGISDASEYVKEMFDKDYEFNVLYVCANNTALFDELTQLKASKNSKLNLVPLGFVSNMNELMMIADFAIAKAGPSTTFEALMSKTPLIFTYWANYVEKPNIDFCIDNRVGWLKQNKTDFFALIDEIQNSSLLEEYQKNLIELDLKSGSNEIASFVIDQLNND